MRHTAGWATRSKGSVLLAAVMLGMVGCSGASSGSSAASAPAPPPPASAQASSDSATQPEPASESASSDASTTLAPIPSTENAPPAEPTPVEQVASVCEAICARTDKVCSRMSKLCRASCDDYVHGAARCPVEIHDALSCQVRADDFLICSSVSPEECAKQVLTMQDCRSGKVAPAEWGKEREQAQEQAIQVPSDWARLEHPSGFSTSFPAGAKWETVAGTELATVQAEGIEYRAHRVSLGGKKLTNSLVLRTVSQEVGRDCEAKLKLHGRYETGDTIHIRFHTTCKGDQDDYGVMHIRGDFALLVYMHRLGHHDAPPEFLDALVFGYSEP